MRRSGSSPDESLRRELKIRRAPEYFWRTSRLECLSNAWHYFSTKWAFFHLISKHSLNFKTESSRKLSNFGSFCRYRKALYFWSLGISLYLELFCFPSFISFVLRNLYSGTHRRNRNFNFQWTKTLYQNNLKNIVLHFTRAKDVICHL